MKSPVHQPCSLPATFHPVQAPVHESGIPSPSVRHSVTTSPQSTNPSVHQSTSLTSPSPSAHKPTDRPVSPYTSPSAWLTSPAGDQSTDPAARQSQGNILPIPTPPIYNSETTHPPPVHQPVAPIHQPSFRGPQSSSSFLWIGPSCYFITSV